MSIGSTINNNLAVQGNLDISGGIIYFSQQQQTSPQQFQNIQLNTSAEGYLSFPYYNPPDGQGSTYAFTPWASFSGTVTPVGLGIIWNYLGPGEVDLIGYGGSAQNTGGISIFSYNNYGNADNPTHIADFWPASSTIYNGLNVGITNTSSSTTNLWGNLNVRGLLSTQTYNASGGGMATNIGIYTYGGSIVSSSNTSYGFNMDLGSGILNVNTNNYNNSSAVWSFSILNNGGINTLLLSETNTSLTLSTSSAQSPASIYININNTPYGGGNIYFTIIGNEPTGLVNLVSLF